mmetsp:Transcript_20920/g.29069  ORF Transcript_20920/g.29069 Transcript_20920/m.29069 type:complete len:268 (-) Transcript_20920:212-1015(-)
MTLFRLITLLAAFGIGANAFSSTAPCATSVGIRAVSQRRSNLFRSSIVSERRSSAFMVSASLDGESSSNDAVLRQIDSKISAFNKKKEKAMKTLDEAEASLQQLQSKKQEYIAGSQLADTPDGGNFSETAVRSAVKAMCWRVIAGSVTFVTSLRFSGSITTALSIVGSDFFSKAFTMFIGERLMNKSSAGRKSGGDNAARSLAKALIWRLFAICNTLTMAFFVAKDLSMASKIAGSDAIFKTALMFFYERSWAKIDWGKEYLIEFSI